jgi:aryl-alcohol dehydrogenase-like predicted oxidoreductase
MRYKYLGQTGIRVSALCLGTGPFGVAPLAEDATALVRHALDLGINFIDTANSYGNFARIDRPGAPPAAERDSAETIVGRALKGHRDEVVLASKVREVVGEGVLDVGLSRRHIMQQIERSLRALQTDYLDLYHMHGPDPQTPIEETLRAMDDLVRQGKVRYIGLSNFSAWRVAVALGEARLGQTELPVVHQIGYNLVSRDAERDVIPATRHFGMSVTTYGSLNGGLLAGTDVLSRSIVGLQRFREDKSQPVPFPEDALAAARQLEKLAADWGHPPAHLALAWLMEQDGHASAIIGPETISELENSIGAAGLHLDEAQLATLSALLPPTPSWEQLYDNGMAAMTARLGS